MSLILLPLLRFLFSALTIAIGRGRRILAVAALAVDAGLLAGLAVTLAKAGTQVTTLGGWGPTVGIGFAMDRIGLTFAALTWGLSVAVLLYTWQKQFRPYFYMLFHLLIGACYALVFTKDLFNAYILFELATLASFLLVGYERRARQIWASLRYLIVSSFGMSLFLVGIAVTYYHAHSLSLDRIAAIVSANPTAPWVLLAATLLMAGIAVKAGIFGFSLWLPLAHSQAIPAVSALLSGVVIKMGIVELFRLSAVFPLDLPLTVLGVGTALLGIAYAVTTFNLKRMLAFHTLSQIGYLLIGFAAGTEAARLGALDYAVAHGLFKSLLFLAVGDLAARAGSSDLHRLVAQRGGLPRTTIVALGIGALGIVGLPPFAGFAAKAVLTSGVHSTILHSLVLVVAAGTVASFSKLLPLFHGPFSGRGEPSKLLSYAWLGGAILLFLPISRAMAPSRVWAACLQWRAYLEALAVIAAGLLLYLAIRRTKWPLPQTLFRLEEAVLSILVGLLFIWSLLALA
jgi:multicomponent Na+:H+ antiporter subunit D